jgi:hypothetical protein
MHSCDCSMQRDRCRQVTSLGTSFEQAPGCPQAGGQRPSCCHRARVQTYTAPTRLAARQVPDAMGQFLVIHSAGGPLLRLPLQDSESIVLKDAACKFSAASRFRAISGRLGTVRHLLQRPTGLSQRSPQRWPSQPSRQAPWPLPSGRSRDGLGRGMPALLNAYGLSSDKHGDNFGTSRRLSTARGPRWKLLSVGPHDIGVCAHRVVGTLMP